MRRIRLIMCLSALFLFATSYGQNEKFKALLIYNFTKYIEWPKAMQKGDFAIGVLGSPGLVNELSIIASRQKVGVQPIVIKIISSVTEIPPCHILYLAGSKSLLLGETLTALRKVNTLVITDGPGLVHLGAGISFVTDGAKMNFEINKFNIEKHRLIVNNTILALGIPVN